MNLVVKEFELEEDEIVKKGTKYIHFIDEETGNKYRPKDELVVIGTDDSFELVEKVPCCDESVTFEEWVNNHNKSLPDSLNHGAPKIPEFEPVIGYAHSQFTEPQSTITWTSFPSDEIEMDKETFVMLVNAVEQNMGVMQDVKQLIYNTDGHTCGFDHLPNSIIEYLSDEFATDLVHMYFFELSLEVENAEQLYDLIIDSRKCSCG